MKIVTLKEARELNITHYFTGKTCKYNHIEKRLTSDRSCTECTRLKRKKYYALNPKKYKNIRNKSYWNNVEKEREIAKIKSAQWRLNNPNKISIKISKDKYKKSAKGKAIESKHRAIRRTGKKQATPIWVDLNAISDVYIEAEYMQMQVDHIIPLKSKLVCGLHTLDNLQLLYSKINNIKGNRYWPDMPV
jgi:hypothetical protein